MIEINGTYYAKDTIKMISKVKWINNSIFYEGNYFEVLIVIPNCENIIEKIYCKPSQCSSINEIRNKFVIYINNNPRKIDNLGI